MTSSHECDKDRETKPPSGNTLQPPPRRRLPERLAGSLARATRQRRGFAYPPRGLSRRLAASTDRQTGTGCGDLWDETGWISCASFRPVDYAAGQGVGTRRACLPLPAWSGRGRRPL
ncbi:50S ribosomal protein L10 [Frankliniella fusca]|uniref:50S ribosomal protein L10 n=1 Tax=Frankliniella fusca TaxID=407009 RepID=A0AAE1H2Q1_9NEOP|nr:50S ribosomal protein L10 [Frankliniella fusca]